MKFYLDPLAFAFSLKTIFQTWAVYKCFLLYM
uniref:Uncharacterized protein n=1 Tax=Anguilla anguilla TaxID=7936 RepID=A0A0E9RXP0_ANGAN